MTEAELQELLATRTEREFREVADRLGIDPEAPVMDWEVGAAPYMLSQISDHWSNVRANPDESALQAESAFDAATDPQSEGGEEVTPTEAQAIESLGGEEVTQDPTPKWMLDANGASYWTDDQKQRLVEYVNFYQGGNFRTFDDLIQSGYLNEATAVNQQTVQAALLDDEPFQSLSVRLPGGDMFTVEAREWESAQSMYGVDSRDLTKIVRVTNQVNAVDSTGKPAWQLMTALMKATGMLSSITDPVGPVRRSQASPPDQTGEWDVGGIVRDAIGLDRPDPQGDTGARRPGEITRRREDVVGEPITDEKALGFDEAGIPVSRFAAPRTAAELSYSINEGMRLYDDSLAMAYIHVLDPQLAAKIKMGARTPGVFTRADQNKLFDLVALSGAPTTEDFRTQLILQGEARLQGDSNDLYGNYIDYLLGGDGGAGGAGGDAGGTQIIRSRPDPASLDERLRELYQTMFFTEPDDETLAKFRAQINSAIDAAGPGEQIDWGARASQFARQDPRYQDLYGNRPTSVSEADYRMQFEAGQASMLGAERADNAPVMAGMRDGTYQTTIGAAAGTSEAFDNSTFLERLARASRAVSEMT